MTNPLAYSIVLSTMIGTTTRQSNLFFLPLAQQLHLLKDGQLDPIDELLNDEELVNLVREKLASLVSLKYIDIF